jgi:hypothetical protein
MRGHSRRRVREAWNWSDTRGRESARRAQFHRLLRLTGPRPRPAVSLASGVVGVREGNCAEREHRLVGLGLLLRARDQVDGL